MASQTTLSDPTSGRGDSGSGNVSGDSVGRRLAEAMAAKDRGRLLALFADDVDFEALTPRRHWVAGTSQEAVDGIVLGFWMRPEDPDLELESVSCGRVADRCRVTYRLAVPTGAPPQVLEQHAYFSVVGSRIGWIRILCSGYRLA